MAVNYRFDPLENYEPVPESGCWIWMGAVSQGYGYMLRGGKHIKAHRLFYEHHKGPIGPFVLDHLCRVRCCVNPDHLEPVTNHENIIRGEGPTAINARKTHCPRGHKYDAVARVVNGPRAGEIQRRCLTCKREQTNRNGGWKKNRKTHNPPSR